MSRQHMPLKDITIGSKGWTAKVIVETKGMPRSSQRSPVKYQRMILRDSAVIHFTNFFLAKIIFISYFLKIYIFYVLTETNFNQHILSGNKGSSNYFRLRY